MWRLIACILIFAVFIAFIVLNLENKCDVSFGIKTFSDVPVFLTAFFSFVFGMLFAIPFIISVGRKRKRKQDSGPSKPISDDESKMEAPAVLSEPASEKKLGFRKKNKSKDPNKIERDESFKLTDELMRENN